MGSALPGSKCVCLRTWLSEVHEVALVGLVGPGALGLDSVGERRVDTEQHLLHDDAL